MRIAIAGCHYGHIGGIIRSAAQSSNGEIVAVAEADAGCIDRYQDLKDVDRFDSVEDMLASSKPELVIEGVTHPEKVGLIEACAAEGAHVILDKPLCRTSGELDRITKAVESSGIRLSMFFTSRFHPPFVALRDAIQSGELGDIVSYISTHPHKLGGGTPFYFDPEAYAGVFHDVACHGVDQLRFLTGAECSGVHGIGSSIHKHSGDHSFENDHVQASYQMSDGSNALLTADWLTPTHSPSFGDTRVIVMGTKGSAHLRAYAEDHLYIVTEAQGAVDPDLPDPGIDRFVPDMIEALERGKEPFISTQDVLGVAGACIAAEESVRRGGEFLAIG